MVNYCRGYVSLLLLFFFLIFSTLSGSAKSTSVRFRFRFSSTGSVASSVGATYASARSACRFLVASAC
jgi:hypothetical protein